MCSPADRPAPDVLVLQQSRVAVVHLHSDRAIRWVEEHVNPTAPRFSNCLVIEAKHLSELVDAMALDELRIH